MNTNLNVLAAARKAVSANTPPELSRDEDTGNLIHDGVLEDSMRGASESISTGELMLIDFTAQVIEDEVDKVNVLSTNIAGSVRDQTDTGHTEDQPKAARSGPIGSVEQQIQRSPIHMDETAFNGEPSRSYHEINKILDPNGAGRLISTRDMIRCLLLRQEGPFRVMHDQPRLTFEQMRQNRIEKINSNADMVLQNYDREVRDFDMLGPNHISLNDKLNAEHCAYPRICSMNKLLILGWLNPYFGLTSLPDAMLHLTICLRLASLDRRFVIMEMCDLGASQLVVECHRLLDTNNPVLLPRINGLKANSNTLSTLLKLQRYHHLDKPVAGPVEVFSRPPADTPEPETRQHNFSDVRDLTVNFNLNQNSTKNVTQSIDNSNQVQSNESNRGDNSIPSSMPKSRAQTSDQTKKDKKSNNGGFPKSQPIIILENQNINIYYQQK